MLVGVHISLRSQYMMRELRSGWLFNLGRSRTPYVFQILTYIFSHRHIAHAMHPLMELVSTNHHTFNTKAYLCAIPAALTWFVKEEFHTLDFAFSSAITKQTDSSE